MTPTVLWWSAVRKPRKSSRLSQARDDAERELIRPYHDGGTTIELCKLTDVLKAKGLLVEV